MQLADKMPDAYIQLWAASLLRGKVSFELKDDRFGIPLRIIFMRYKLPLGKEEVKGVSGYVKIELRI